MTWSGVRVRVRVRVGVRVRVRVRVVVGVRDALGDHEHARALTLLRLVPHRVAHLNSSQEVSIVGAVG